MAQQQGKVRFIRVRGKVVPIRDKGPSKQQSAKNYKKYGDGANQASRIDQKYEAKANKGSAKFGLVGAAGILGAIGLKGRAAVASGLLGGAALITQKVIAGKRMKKTAVARDREYVRAFGRTSTGGKPSSSKKGARTGNW